MYAIQGAMAVRRERNKRRARRISQLRRGSQSGSLYSVVLEDEEEEQPPPKTSSSLTAFHIGVVFILLGFIMIFSSLIGTNNMSDYEYDEDERAQHRSDWSKLLGVGVTFIIIGLLMVMVNRIITSREEEELEEYVKRRLARTRSGHALVRDAEAHYPRRLSSHPAALQQQHQQYLRRPSTSGAYTKSPRGSGKGLRRTGATNGSVKAGGMERGDSFYSGTTRESRQQSLKDNTKRQSLSTHHLPSVTTENERKSSEVGETDRLLNLQHPAPSPSVSYSSEPHYAAAASSEPQTEEHPQDSSSRRTRSSSRRSRQD